MDTQKQTFFTKSPFWISHILKAVLQTLVMEVFNFSWTASSSSSIWRIFLLQLVTSCSASEAFFSAVLSSSWTWNSRIYSVGYIFNVCLRLKSHVSVRSAKYFLVTEISENTTIWSSYWNNNLKIALKNS